MAREVQLNAPASGPPADCGVRYRHRGRCSGVQGWWRWRQALPAASTPAAESATYPPQSVISCPPLDPLIESKAHDAIANVPGKPGLPLLVSGHREEAAEHTG